MYFMYGNYTILRQSQFNKKKPMLVGWLAKVIQTRSKDFQVEYFLAKDKISIPIKVGINGIFHRSIEIVDF